MLAVICTVFHSYCIITNCALPVDLIVCLLPTIVKHHKGEVKALQKCQVTTFLMFCMPGFFHSLAKVLILQFYAFFGSLYYSQNERFLSGAHTQVAVCKLHRSLASTEAIPSYCCESLVVVTMFAWLLILVKLEYILCCL